MLLRPRIFPNEPAVAAAGSTHVAGRSGLEALILWNLSKSFCRAKVGRDEGLVAREVPVCGASRWFNWPWLARAEQGLSGGATRTAQTGQTNGCDARGRGGEVVPSQRTRK